MFATCKIYILHGDSISQNSGYVPHMILKTAE